MAKRERMREFDSTIRPRRSARPLILIILAAFALGAVGAGWGVYRFGDRLGLATQDAASRMTAQTPRQVPAPIPSATNSQVAQEAVKAAQIVAQQQGGLDERLAAAEQRIARLDLQAQAASGNAARAEGLLIAFSARRALERGEDLGFLADQLRLRFGDAMPRAVETVLATARRPVTLDQLIANLDRLSPDLAQSSRRVTWTRVRDEMASLFVVRRENTPSPQPARRLERARLFLQSGRVAAAIAEVERLPGAADARSWIAEAKRYAAAQGALDLIETPAVTEPRPLRDGTGQPVQQGSPVVAEPALVPSGPQ